MKTILLVMLCLNCLSILTSCSGKPPTPFDEVISQYTSMANLPEASEEPGYIVGKAVLINTGETISFHRHTAFTKEDHEYPSNTVSSAHQRIDAQIRASSPAEVSTVVLLEWRVEQVGRNIAGITFHRLYCTVIIIDKSKQRIISRKSFAGLAPEGRYQYGTSPENDIVNYLNSLPKKGPSPNVAADGDSNVELPSKLSNVRKYLDVVNKLSFSYPVANDWGCIFPFSISAT